MSADVKTSLIVAVSVVVVLAGIVTAVTIGSIHRRNRTTELRKAALAAGYEEVVGGSYSSPVFIKRK